jgi:hypothetical protein
MAALDKARSALAKEPEATTDDFRTTVLGGPDLMARLGIPYDAVAGVARGDAGKNFCRRRNIQSTFRANYAMYGAKACGVLARFCVHKMQFYYNLEQAHHLGQDLVLAAEHHALYVEPTEVEALLGEAGCSVACQRRVAAIRVILV